MYTGNILNTNNIDNLIAVYPCVYREHTRIMSNANCLSGLSLCVQGTSVNDFLNLVSQAVYPCVYREHELF